MPSRSNDSFIGAKYFRISDSVCDKYESNSRSQLIVLCVLENIINNVEFVSVCSHLLCIQKGLQSKTIRTGRETVKNYLSRNNLNNVIDVVYSNGLKLSLCMTMQTNTNAKTQVCTNIYGWISQTNYFWYFILLTVKFSQRIVETMIKFIYMNWTFSFIIIYLNIH